MVRRFQFRLKSLMAAVVLICLGLGGWHLLWTKGQYVEAEPAVVGQPIKIRGRFFHSALQRAASYTLNLFPTDEGMGGGVHGRAEYIGWWINELELHFVPSRSGEFTIIVTLDGRSPIRGIFVMRAAD